MKFLGEIMHTLESGGAASKFLPSEDSRAHMWHALVETWHGHTAFFASAPHGPEERTMIEEKDYGAWIIFTVVFFALVIFDNTVLHTKGSRPSPATAAANTCFWICCGIAFNIYVYHTRGFTSSINWGTGYFLELMLSMDNLFVFQRIFALMQTPESQKHTPLFIGIMGAVFFRMLLFVFFQALMYYIWWIHFVFGAFLIYTGIQAARSEDDDDEDSWILQKLQQNLRYVDAYHATEARFFVYVPINKKTGELAYDANDPSLGSQELILAAPALTALRDQENPSPVPREENPDIIHEWRGTRLLLVVIFLEITDVIFAVDSVSVIVAQIPDLYLSYTACVFAMLGLRAMFFLVDEMVKAFALLGYAIAIILIAIGFKLILRDFVHVNPLYMCCFIITTFLLSIVASLIQEKYFKKDEDEDECSEGKVPNSSDTVGAASNSSSASSTKGEGGKKGRKHALRSPVPSPRTDVSPPGSGDLGGA